jgi:chaperonin GroES
MDTRPLHDRVVLRRDERQRHSAGGILTPDTAGEKPTEGRVMAVGKGKILENGKVPSMNLKVGHRAWTTSSRRGHRHRSALRTS